MNDDLKHKSIALKYKVTVYCGRAGPVQDIEVLANNPADATCEALFRLQAHHRPTLTEIHINAITEA